MKEDLSAWMDGEVSAPQARQLLPQVERNAELRSDWDCYHLIGDVLRGTQGPDLCAKICARLDAEPTVLAPRRRRREEKLIGYALSLAASIAAVVFVGWMALPGTEQAPQVAAVAALAPEPKQIAVAAGEGANDYLLAHQRYSPSSAMQGVAPYVRTVADERRASRR
ncbi:MAG: sigma-E factor negative regulatory protein [Pseudomonadota bacterium]